MGREEEVKTAWRVFVVLRHRQGVWERTIRATGPLEAEHAVAADRDVIETLGAQGLVRQKAADCGQTDYRSVHAVGRWFLPIRLTGSPGSGGRRVAIVEVLAPKAGS
jgi:hypothetical protein